MTAVKLCFWIFSKHFQVWKKQQIKVWRRNHWNPFQAYLSVFCWIKMPEKKIGECWAVSLSFFWHQTTGLLKINSWPVMGHVLDLFWSVWICVSLWQKAKRCQDMSHDMTWFGHTAVFMYTMDKKKIRVILGLTVNISTLDKAEPLLSFSKTMLLNFSCELINSDELQQKQNYICLS